MNGPAELYQLLDQLQVSFDYYEHPAAPTIEEAKKYWADIEATHCKNLFFRNHKGDRHYLVVLHYQYKLNIHDLEKRLKQGKLTFASEQRMWKYLQVKPGSVSPLALFADTEKHVTVFFDEKLKEASKLSFHPCINTASLVIPMPHFMRFIEFCGNTHYFVSMYD
ncbi:MAG TPA: prolyl-tRNA synthetase associated domain-containing protein [Bacteroidales bacterium]|nr:prolyl-tRNA synthetase associated domain-containing protein [Bacteroidales bacterium]